MKKLAFLILCLPVFFMGQTANKKISALFLGNSYTYVNDLPLLVSSLALANGDTLVYDSNTPGGYTFYDHFNDNTSKAKINASAWKYVVLQAQSQEPSFSPAQVYAQTLPFAIKLDSIIKHNNSCTNTVFYETWGRKNGDASNCASYAPVCTYSGMQDRLKQSYKRFADTCNVVMSPVGEAFRRSIALDPTLELYQADESHPSVEGSYLAACVFYEVLFQKSVLSNTFISTVNSTTATFLQQVAHAVVNDSLALWNLGKNLPWADYSYNSISALNYQFGSNSPTLTNKWYFGDAAVSAQANPAHVYATAGTYTVSHVVSTTCKKDSVSKILIIGTVGIHSINKEQTILIYPNPVNDHLTIQGSTDLDNTNSFIEIINSSGQSIYKGRFSSTIITKDLERGVYDLRIYDHVNNLNFQFIKGD